MTCCHAVALYVSLHVLAAGATPPRPTQQALGPLPPEASTLPGDSQLLMGLDVRPFVGSPFYKRFAQPGTLLRPTALDTLRRECQLDPERDLDQIVVARGPQGELAIMALGRFDRKTLESAWARRPSTGSSLAIAFPSARAFTMGQAAWVGNADRRTVRPTLGTNATLAALLRQVPAKASFWMVGTGDALSLLAAGSGKPQSSTSLPLGLPPLKSVVITGNVEPQVTLAVVAEALDEKAARSLAETLKGFLALAALQSQRKPALKDLASAVSVTTDGARVQLGASLTSEMLEALLPRPAAANPAAAGAAAAPAPEH